MSRERARTDLRADEEPVLQLGERERPPVPAQQGQVASTARPTPGLKQRARALALIAAGVVVAVASIAGDLVMHRPQLPPAFHLTTTVTTRPPTMVEVNQLAHPFRSTPLGVNPRKVDGVHEGDLVTLTNEDLGIHETRIAHGDEDGNLVWNIVYQEGQVTVDTTPKLDPGQCPLSVYRGGQKLGQAGLKLKLYDTPQSLELRGDCLRAPVRFDVTPVAGKPKTVHVDVKDYLWSP